MGVDGRDDGYFGVVKELLLKVFKWGNVSFSFVDFEKWIIIFL